MFKGGLPLCRQPTRPVAGARRFGGGGVPSHGDRPSPFPVAGPTPLYSLPFLGSHTSLSHLFLGPKPRLPCAASHSLPVWATLSARSSVAGPGGLVGPGASEVRTCSSGGSRGLTQFHLGVEGVPTPPTPLFSSVGSSVPPSVFSLSFPPFCFGCFLFPQPRWILGNPPFPSMVSTGQGVGEGLSRGARPGRCSFGHRSAQLPLPHRRGPAPR